MQPQLSDTITVERMKFTDVSTIGEIRVDGELLCYCLEPSTRKGNPSGIVSIPQGKYQITMTDEPQTPKELEFGFALPHIENVPGREAIEIHPGNTAADTKGCILPGMRWDNDVVYDSRKAFGYLVTTIKERLAKGPLYVAIVGGGQ